jgi:hypothetical protein
MLLIATAALIAAAPADAPAGATVQARASVRILSAVRLKLDEEQQSADGIPEARQTSIRTDAGPQPAKLIEFE